MRGEPAEHFSWPVIRKPTADRQLSAPCYFFFGAAPVPESGIFCGAPDASSLMINSPVCSVVSGGVKATETSQLLAGANVLLHSFLTAKGGAVVSPMIETLIFELFEVAFLIVTNLALLALSTVVLSPKSTEPGLIVSLPAGVAVGVAVAVRVAVAVGVAAVAVAVGVAAVEVAVGVAVGPGDEDVGMASAYSSTRELD